MVGEDLAVFVDAVRDSFLEPLGEPLVQLRARPLGQRRVGRVADQDVLEAVGVVSLEQRPVRVDQLAPHEPLEVGSERGPLRVRRQSRQCRLVEHPALHRSALHHPPFLAVQPVEPRGQERLDGQRDVGAGGLVLAQHRQHLLDEQRVALGRRDHPLALLDGQRLARQILEQPRAVLRRQPLEHDRGGVGLSPGPSGRTSSRSGRAVHRISSAHPRAQSATCSIRSSRVGSAQWMSSNTSTVGRRSGDDLERPAKRPEHLLDRGRSPAQTDRPGDPLGNQEPVLVVCDQPLQRRTGSRPVVTLADLGRRLAASQRPART